MPLRKRHQRRKIKGQVLRVSQSKAHYTSECMLLKKEIEENQLMGNLYDIAKDLGSNFDAD